MSQQPPVPHNVSEYEEILRRVQGTPFPVTELEINELDYESEKPPLPHVVEEQEKWRGEETETEQEKYEKTCWHHLDDPNKLLWHRHQVVAQYLAHGMPQWKIAEKMEYTSEHVSNLSCHPKVRKKVAQLQDKAFEMSVGDRFKGLNHAALDVIEHVITSDDKNIKWREKQEAAKWLLEKTTGKAKQEIESRDGNLTDFMTLLKQAQQHGRAMALASPAVAGSTQAGTSLGTDFIEVTQVQDKSDSLAQWVEEQT